MLIEVHLLQNHAPSNLNRDDTGSPKEAVFGGYKRARISSQCLKRSIRRSDIFETRLQDMRATRTRSLPELVRKRLIERGIAEDVAAIAASKTSGFGTEKGTEQKPNEGGFYRTAQTMFLTGADIEAVTDVMEAAAREAGDAAAFQKMDAKELQKRAVDSGIRPVSVDVALFGRMVTSEAFVNVEAACQVAHAISTHKIDHEFDYFTAVDDLDRDAADDAGGGADMIGDVEFNSACYYKYFNIHIDGLIDNLTGRAFDREVTDDDTARARHLAATAVRTMVEAACRVTPTGKQNTFAAHQLPALLWVEVRDTNLPVSYANAFSHPVNPRSGSGLERASADALKSEIETLTRMYGLEARTRLLLTRHDGLDILDTASQTDLDTLLEALEQEVVRA